MTFLNYYTYFFSISEKTTNKISGRITFAQAKPVEILQNESINNQLNTFLKSYKFEKLVTNYKKIQTFIPNNSFDSNKTMFSTNKLYAPLENKNVNFMNPVAGEIGNFKTFTDSKGQVLTNNVNNLIISTDFIKGNNLKHLTYKKFKENLYFKMNNMQIIGSNSTSKQINCNEVKFSKKIRKTWFKNTSSILQNEHYVSSNQVNLSLKSTYAIASDLRTCDSGQISTLQHEAVKSLSRFGIYYFLQKLLSKYLDLYNISSRHVTLLNNPEQIKINLSMVSLLNLKIPTQKPNSVYFVFTELNQKTFLSYWLLPVAGLALLTSPLLKLTSESVAVYQFNSFINKKTDVMLLENREVSYTGFGLQTPFVNINTVKPSINLASESDVPANSVLYPENQEVYHSHLNDLLSIKNCFSNLYNYINNKTELSTKNLFFFSAIKTDATTQKNNQSFFPVLKTTNLINKHNFVKGHFKSSIATKYSIGGSFIGPTHLEQMTNVFSSYLPITNVISISQLVPISYLNAISPINSKFMIDHSLKFITPKTTLKLLQKKLSKCPKEIYAKTNILSAPKDLIMLNSLSFDQVNLRTSNFFRGNLRPLNNYNNALKLLNLYQKNFFPFGQINFKPINFNKTLDCNPFVAYLINKPDLRVNTVNALNQKCSQIVYKQSLNTVNLLKSPSIEIKIESYCSNQNQFPNKNAILLEYFLVSKTPNTDILNKNAKSKITKFKLNLTKTTLPVKTCIKNHFPVTKVHKAMHGLVRNEQKSNNLNLGSITFNSGLSVVSNVNLLTRDYTELTKRHGSLRSYKLDKSFNSYLIYLDQNLTKFIQLNQNSLKKNKLEKDTLVKDYYKYSSIRGLSLQDAPTVVRGSKQFLNSLTILFKHQKMFKKKIAKSNKVKLHTKSIFKKSPKASFGLGRQWQLPANCLNFSNGPEKDILSTRLHIQKKRKAKKQRLETRRQKKRTRFFPRPVWLRYRMFLNFLTERNKYNVNSTLIKQAFSRLGSSSTTITTIPMLKENILKFKSPRELSSTIESSKNLGQALNNPIFNKILNQYLLSSRHHPLKLRELANYPKIELMHKFKKFENKKQNLRDIKIKGNYSNFKNQKANNPPQQNDKDKDKDTMFRDFWVWSYNNTQTNAFNQNLWWLLPNLTTKQNNLELFSSSYAKAKINGNGITTTLNNSGRVNKCQTALIRLNWALNKTNVNTFTDYSKRYNLWTTQKLRNQSKNNKTKYLEKQFITNWEKFFLNKNLTLFSKKILTKLKQKQKKLNYITSYLNVKSEQNFKIFNNAWWTHLNIENLINNKTLLIPEGEGHLATGRQWQLPANGLNFNSDFINLAIIKSINNTTFLENYLYSPASEKEKLPFQANNGQLVFISSSILLHLCAIISLVSISQVRCFVKFHLILLYKLSNVYTSLLNQVSNTLQKKLPVYNTIPKLNSRYFYTNYKSSPTKSQKKLLTYFSFTLLKKHFLTGTKPAKKSSNAQEVFLLPNRAWQPVGVVTKDISLPGGVYLESEKQKASTQPSKSMYAKLNILSLKTIFLKQFLINKKPYSSKIILPPSVDLTSKNNIKQSQLVQRIKMKELQLSLKKNSIGFSKVAKNHIFKIFLNIIEVFQTGVRHISSFFEKPAEFTTTWIAYGFLVEWSSDFITIIPENVDIYIWNVFSKIYRPMPLSFISTTLVPTNIHPLIHSTIPIKMGYFNYQKMLEFPVLLSIAHLLHHRILYLFDTLFSTITQPDADLIARQEKGTLFWDIWADFLVTAADYYNVNVAALSTIKAEQNSLIENISNDFDSLTMSSQKGFTFSGKSGLTLNTRFWLNKLKGTKVQNISLENPKGVVQARKHTFNGFLHIYSPQEETLLKNTNPAKNALGVNKFLSHDKTSLKLFNQLNLQLFVNKNKIKPYFEAYFSTTQQKINMDIMQGFEKFNFQQSTFPEGNLNRWSVNQFITYQSWHSHNGSNNSNGDLFIDYHPPKTFSHIPALKYNSILQQPIGSLVCQIYSGLFNKQISKNMLLVNPKTTNHNLADYNVLLIQALAGETEMKIITDNAQRYALVNRGFAIGIKLLREVFDAIALNTPCIFLLEDIHAIGERRPMLISDYGGGMSDDNGSFKEDFFGSQRDEVHEKNQVVYQLTRHAITHYKKPFKGDYSLAIPTNLYVTDLFLKLPTQSISNLTNIENHNLSIKNKIQNNLPEHKRNLVGDINKNSYLQITQFTKTLAPPSTSPFSVLLLKEEKRLKPNKIVDELSWTGLPGEQLATKPRTSYSVRAKVAMLAELSLSNLSAKLDMITDLLVIIDSVRSNKGFVVFATTDIPHVLDPALRRPGRLDETICLPNINHSNILNFTKNYEIFKSAKHTSTFGHKIILNQLQHSTNLFSLQDINPSYLPTNSQTYTNNLWTQRGLLTINLKDYNILLNQVNLTEGKSSILNSSIHNNSQQKSLNFALISYSKKLKELNFVKAHHNTNKQKQLVQKSVTNSKTNFKKKYKDKAIIYYEVGKFLLNYFLNNQLTNLSVTEVSSRKQAGTIKPSEDITIFGNDFLNLKTINYLSLYNSKNKILLQLMLIFGGKISQLLSSKNLIKFLKQASVNSDMVDKVYLPANAVYKYPEGEEIRSIYPVGMPLEQNNLLPKALSVLATPMIFSDGYNNQNVKTATTLLLSFIHKRYLYRKNLIVPKLLSFADGNILDEPPSPPFSSLLIPAKRFENYKRFFRDTLTGDKMGQRKSQITLLEKLQYHMQLRSIKQLNSTFSSQGNLNLQSNAALTSQKLDTLMSLSTNNLLQNPTNINWYYQNRILKRHGQYLTNQWWNGQLSEHNAETVFLSDIDWRSSFIKNKNTNITKSKNLYSLTQQKNKTEGLDVLLDFPDTDQYYNPKRRRWLLNKGSWNFWFNFDKLYSEEIVRTWILESLIQTYKYLHKNTELLDFVTNKFITLGYMAPENTNLQHLSGFPGQSELLSTKEIILTNSFKRF